MFEEAQMLGACRTQTTHFDVQKVIIGNPGFIVQQLQQRIHPVKQKLSQGSCCSKEPLLENILAAEGMVMELQYDNCSSPMMVCGIVELVSLTAILRTHCLQNHRVWNRRAQARPHTVSKAVKWMRSHIHGCGTKPNLKPQPIS